LYFLDWMHLLSLNSFRIFTRFIVVGLLFGVGACTTSNQEALGVGIGPSTTTASTSTDPNAGGETNTQTALAPATDTASPSQAAALGVTASDDANASSVQIAKVGFLPITGAPQKAVTSLSRAFGAVSKQHNVGIVGKGDARAQYQLKGYMSALNEGSRTTVTFYWDVLDRSGKRLYRINGFEQENGAKANPWDGVSNATMQRIANRTIGGFATWVKRKGA